MTLSHYAEGKGGFLEGAAAVGDLVNPLSVLKDALDIWSTARLTGLSSDIGAFKGRANDT